MLQIPIWDYSSISRESYIALYNFEKEKSIRNYYFDLKIRGSGKFDIFHFFLESLCRRQFKSREAVKLILIQAEGKVMQGCFYSRKCEDCNILKLKMNVRLRVC